MNRGFHTVMLSDVAHKFFQILICIICDNNAIVHC